MRIAFSEYRPDYGRYIFPYHVWGFLEDGESVAAAVAQGFLPSTFDLSRFYLTRSVRVDLRQFRVTGRIRYVQRRCADITHELVMRDRFDFSAPWQGLAAAYFAAQSVAARHRSSRFAEMLDAPYSSHVLAFRQGNGEPAGLVPLCLTEPVGLYGIPVYQPLLREVSIGNHMMATTLELLRDRGFEYLYLGSCYSSGDLYKTRFTGMQFFNGYAWSGNKAELQYLLNRQDQLTDTHLLDHQPYVESYRGTQVFIPDVTIGRLSG